MNIESINKIEEAFPNDGLTGHLFHFFTKFDCYNLCEVVTLEEGACLVLKGTAPARERREMFLQIYDGCREISKFLKEQASREQEKYKQNAIEFNDWMFSECDTSIGQFPNNPLGFWHKESQKYHTKLELYDIYIKSKLNKG